MNMLRVLPMLEPGDLVHLLHRIQNLTIMGSLAEPDLCRLNTKSLAFKEVGVILKILKGGTTECTICKRIQRKILSEMKRTKCSR